MKLHNICLMILLLLPVGIWGQNEITISGTVSDAMGTPLPGASIVVKGTTMGTQTDFDGNFQLANVPSNARLVVSYLGFVSQELPVNANTTFSIVLEEDAQTLDEVVVIGYGTAQKRDLTGSIVKIEGDVVADKPASNPVESLQGRVSGLSVVNSGELNEKPDIRIRGTSSRYNSEPLYVVDGIFADNIDFVNPNDIQSIEVLKDASSLAIFGVRGANGVILITTKKAKQGKLTVNFNTTTGFKKIVGAPEMADARLFKELYNERLANEGISPYAFYDLYSGDTDWVQTIAKRSPLIQTNNLSVQSATERNKISFGLGYRKEQGLIQKEEMQRITMNLNNEFQLTDNIKIGVTANGIKDNLPNTMNFSSSLNATPIVDPIHADGRADYNGLYNELPQAMGAAQIANPLMRAAYTKNRRRGEQYRFVGNVFGEIDFFKYFTFKASYYGDFNNNRTREYTPMVPIYAAETDEVVIANGTQLTQVTQSTTNTFNFQQEYLLSFKRDFEKHGVNALAGFTTVQTNYEKQSATVKHDPAVGMIPDNERFWYAGVFPYGDPTSYTVDSDQYDRATQSFLGRVIYDYDGKYLLNASYRRDATSQLAPENRAQDFWSLGAGWIVTRENFLNESTTLNMLKLKGSVGTLGNQFIPVDYTYPYYPGVVEGTTAVFGENVIPGYTQRFEENPNLQWETVNLWEAGFESNWFENRFMLNANYYNRKTDNLLVLVDIGTSRFFDNSGEIQNHGFEFETSWSDTFENGFSYSLGGNLTTINNEVLSTREDAAIIAGNSRTISGEPIGSFYGYVVEGIYQSNAHIEASVPSELGTYAPGDFRYKDVNGDGVVNTDDRTIIGNPTPDFTYGFYTNLNYKAFSLSMDFQGVYGNELYRSWGNGSSFTQFNYRADRANRWTQSGSSNWEPRIYEASSYNRLPSTYMIEDGSYLRIRNVQLGYTMDSDMLNIDFIQRLKIFANVQNLYTWKNNSGFTPEAGGSPVEFGVDNGGYPIPAIGTLGFNVTF